MEEDTILDRENLVSLVTKYLPLLQEKQKWCGTVPNSKVGNLVLMIIKATSRGKWPKAIVVEVLPDNKSLVRRVCVRTADGSVLWRDVRKLYYWKGKLVNA